MTDRHHTEAGRPRSGWRNPSSIDSAYDEALAFLGKRDAKKAGPNTDVIRGDGNVLVRYHGNLIVIYEPGRITLNSQGYRTYTTKERINWFLPEGYSLFQERHAWFIQGPQGREPFEDGMTLTSRGGGLDERRGKRVREDREPPRIRISFSRIVWVDPEDPDGYEEEHGWIDEEGIEFEPDEFDIEEGMTPSESIIRQAVELLQNDGATNASSSHFHIGVWYSTEFSVTDYGTGEEEERSFHLDGFSPEEEATIFKEVAR